jgi:glucose/arabinose dehydrogenase
MAFGSDGMLYISVGDGGSTYQWNAQDKSSLLGKLLRIDVDSGTPYSIPSGNPFVNDPAARGEIWALGFRNPWRISFDRQTGLLYVADVGENSWEEVNIISSNNRGGNYGWPVLEGTRCFPASSSCNAGGFNPPVLEYANRGNPDLRDNPPRECSVIGGYVYRGQAIPSLHGHYFYGDLCAGWVRSFRYVGGEVKEPREWSFPSLAFLVTFGQDAAGEIYVLPYTGTVQKLVRDFLN